MYGVTRERIRQIESKTMSKLRHPSRSQTLRDFWINDHLAPLCEGSQAFEEKNRTVCPKKNTAPRT